MARTDIVQAILKDSSYPIFREDEIQELKIVYKTVRGKQTPHVQCAIRDKLVQAKPEEIVRQLYTARLLRRYHYSKENIAFEHQVSFGREKKRADIVVFEDGDRPYIIVEVKKPDLLDGKEQLRSYCNATGAYLAVWTNGQQISHYNRKDPNYFEEITDIPDANQTLEDIRSEHFTLKNLIDHYELETGRKSLKNVILELEDEVLANAGVDVFEEVFKLIFTKLYDESESRSERNYIDLDLPNERLRRLEFRKTGQSDSQLKTKIQQLFKDAKNRWSGVFAEHSDFELSDSHLAICVSSLQDIALFNSNLQIIDEAFEYLVSKSAKADKGQYFTPRHVIDMCVKMLNPKRGEYMIDTAAGSCGFPVHTIFKLTDTPVTNSGLLEKDKDVLKVFGIDFDEKAVRVARALNLIAGDGQTNVLHLNTLDYERWSDRTKKDPRWIRTYGDCYERLKEQRQDDQNQKFAFDVLMTNPPFAGDIKEPRILHRYDLSFKADGKVSSKVRRDILFIERNLDFLKPGGRMATVLPQGRLNNTSDKYIRKFIAENARILAVVSLHANTFKPHTGTKTSVLFLQKWNDNPDKGPLCLRVDDYPIFFATSEKSGKNNSGDYVYLESGDEHRHRFLDHDLDDIAEAFIEWAKLEGLSFWS